MPQPNSPLPVCQNTRGLDRRGRPRVGRARSRPRPVERFGAIDVVCNNAGVSTFNFLADQTLDDWRWVLSVNLWGVVHGVNAFLPILQGQRATGPHREHRIGGRADQRGGIDRSLRASKAAVISLSETLRIELELLGSPIKVSVLCPGATTSNVVNSERVRPPELGHELRGDISTATREALTELLVGPHSLPPDAVAEQVLDAIRTDDFWIIAHQWERPVVQERNDQMLARYPEPPADEPEDARPPRHAITRPWECAAVRGTYLGAFAPGGVGAVSRRGDRRGATTNGAVRPSRRGRSCRASPGW